MSKAPAFSVGSFEAHLAPRPEAPDNPPFARPVTADARGRLTAPLFAALGECERKRLIELDAAVGERLQLATLWPALRAGTLRVAKVFQHGTREYLLLDEHQAFAQRPEVLDARQERMLERLLSGSSQKAIGIDLGVCPSTVSMSLGMGLDRLGLRCSVSRLPLSLNLVVLSGHRSDFLARGCIVDDASGRRLVSVEWPKCLLLDSLSPSEREVAELLVDGYTAREIARARDVSPRTIANQLASIFTKFKLSGRVQLMAYLAASTLKGAVREASPSGPIMMH
jgi:DNA-binding CsgD family transcriptional regulator